MALEVSHYDTADYLLTDEHIYGYLEAELEANEMPYLARALNTVIRARGGSNVVARETGLSQNVLENATREDGPPDRATITTVMSAYRSRALSSSLVA